ncbi:hypothetical protein [uncultured Adlercreutzia sp.]|uniref:hypothetical protein n=1 Tax=uncultured Adlercreutzia sp. TaxID=875803 RepID=UPI0026F402FA|nr:hypothetical protein [uncultured Adlercreutzia sp.]
MDSKVKIAGATVSAMALVGSAVGVAVPALAQEPVGCEAAIVAADTQAAAAEGAVAVEGVFSFSQAATTPTQGIVEVFNKAATTLCAALPQYDVDAQGRAVCVKSPNTAFVATVDEMGAEDAAESYIIGCACATNGPGGGAIMNAEVEGVSLAAVAAMAQA